MGSKIWYGNPYTAQLQEFDLDGRYVGEIKRTCADQITEEGDPSQESTRGRAPNWWLPGPIPPLEAHRPCLPGPIPPLGKIGDGKWKYHAIAAGIILVCYIALGIGLTNDLFLTV